MKEAKIFEVSFESAAIPASSKFAASKSDDKIAPVINHDFLKEAAAVITLDFAADSAVKIKELKDAELKPAISETPVQISPAPFRDRTAILRLKPAKVLRASVRGIPVTFPLVPISSAPEDVQRRIVAEIAVRRRLSLSDVTVACVHLKCPISPPPRETAVRASAPPPVFTDFVLSESKSPGEKSTGKISLKLPAEGKWPEPAIIAVCRDKAGDVFAVVIRRAETD